MNFFTGLGIIKLFNSLFELIDPYTKDMVYWRGTKNIKYENQTKPEIYRCNEK